MLEDFYGVQGLHMATLCCLSFNSCETLRLFQTNYGKSSESIAHHSLCDMYYEGSTDCRVCKYRSRCKWDSLDCTRDHAHLQFQLIVFVNEWHTHFAESIMEWDTHRVLIVHIVPVSWCPMWMGWYTLWHGCHFHGALTYMIVCVLEKLAKCLEALEKSWVLTRCWTHL